MNSHKIKIADFNIEFTVENFYDASLLGSYKADFEKPDIAFHISEEELKFEASLEENARIKRKSRIVYYAAFRKIAGLLPLNNSVLFHGVAMDINSVGVAFSAHSGTGKTTHMMLWQDLLGDKMTVVNGDKPFVRFFDSPEGAPEGTKPGVPYAYGTPWMGKERLGCNMRTELKHICFIERSETNYVERIAKKDAIDRIFNQVYMPGDPAAMANTIDLINRLLDSCNLWIIHCNMEPDAAATAYNAIFNS